MSKKKRKVAFIVSIVVVLLLVLSLGFFFVFQTAFPEDDFIIREDFSGYTTGNPDFIAIELMRQNLRGERTDLTIPIEQIPERYCVYSSCEGARQQAIDSLRSGSLSPAYIQFDNNYGVGTREGVKIGSNVGQINPADYWLRVPFSPTCGSGSNCGENMMLYDNKDYRGNDVRIKMLGNVYIVESNNMGQIRISTDGVIGLVELKSSTVNSDNVYVSVNGNDKGTINLQGRPLKLKFGSGTWIDFIAYNPLGCEIRDDEEIFYTPYKAGSKIHIDDLKPRPIHFCPQETHFLIRDMGTNNIVGDRGELMRKLVRGETIIVPESKIYYPHWVGKYVQGIRNRC